MKDQEPDDDEKAIRFGCGALLGALIGVIIAFEIVVESYGLLACIMALSVLLCGFLAMRYGDDFWRWVLEAFASGL